MVARGGGKRERFLSFVNDVFVFVRGDNMFVCYEKEERYSSNYKRKINKEDFGFGFGFGCSSSLKQRERNHRVEGVIFFWTK